MLERGEEIRIELELKVVIVFGVVISLRAHAEPIHSYPSIGGAGGSSFLQRPILILRRHHRLFTNKKGSSLNITIRFMIKLK